MLVFFISDRVCDVRADLGLLISLKLLLGFVNQSFSFSVVLLLAFLVKYGSVFFY